MENLDQIRASHALNAAPRVDKQSVTRLPSMIVNNGLLAAAAFASTENKKDDLGRVMTAVADHLKSRKLVGTEVQDAESLVRDLSARSSESLRLATDEALAYLTFLKRFAKKDEKKGE